MTKLLSAYSASKQFGSNISKQNIQKQQRYMWSYRDGFIEPFWYVCHEKFVDIIERFSHGKSGDD